jgi:hypothetical protein
MFVVRTGPVRCQWLFSKQLTASDTNKLGRIILPRQAGLLLFTF